VLPRAQIEFRKYQAEHRRKAGIVSSVDLSGKEIFSNTLPPKTCQSQSMKVYRAIRFKILREKGGDYS
jgi:hypothetical protein